MPYGSRDVLRVSLNGSIATLDRVGVRADGLDEEVRERAGIHERGTSLDGLAHGDEVEGVSEDARVDEGRVPGVGRLEREGAAGCRRDDIGKEGEVTARSRLRDGVTERDKRVGVDELVVALKIPGSVQHTES